MTDLVKRRDALAKLAPTTIEGRVPPHDIDAEAAVLSAVLLAGSMVSSLLFLQPRHFYSEAHGRIWEAILELHTSAIQIDVVIVGTWLKDHERIAQVGGMSYLTELLNAAPAVAHVDRYARIVVEKWRARNMIARAQEIAAQGYLTDDIRAWIAEAETSILDVTRGGSASVRMLGAEDIFAPVPDQLPWLIPELRLIQGRANMLIGYSFSGKTLIAQHIGACVATGRAVFGLHRVQRPGLVRHLNYDQPWLDTRIRYQRIAYAMGATADELRGKLEVVQYPRVYLDVDEHEGEIRALCQGAALVIIDALTGSVDETEENSPAMGRVIYRLNAISEETGTTILIIHHAGKRDTGPRGKRKKSDLDTQDELVQRVRGSSSIFGALGSAFVLEPMGRGRPVRIHHVKTPALASDLLDEFAVRFVDIDDPGEEHEDLTTGAITHTRKPRGRAGVRVEHMNREQVVEMLKAEKKKEDPDENAAFEQFAARVLEVLKGNPGISGADVKARLTRCSKDRVYAALRWLQKNGKAVAEQGKRNAELWRAA